MLPDRTTRAGSFGTIAEDYDRFRPGPSDAAVAWLLPVDAARAADVGAGTGALSEVLLRRVPDVVAVEPDHRMIAVIAQRAPGAHRVIGRAEAIPLGGLTVDFVGVSSAWHWMDPGRALPEMARVLRPGGVLGVLWGGADRSVPWVGQVLGEARSRTSRTRRSVEGLRRDEGPRRRLDVSADGPFSPPRTETFVWSVPYRVEDLVGLAASYSGIITRPDAERAAALEAVAELVAEHPALRGRGWVDLPMRCSCWRAERRSVG